MPHQKTPTLAGSPWPEITEGYEDEFGFVDPDVYKLAGMVWPVAESLSLRAIQDSQNGQRLLIKTAAIVTRKFAEHPERMTNLKGYILKTFCRLLSAETAKISKHAQLDAEFEGGFSGFSRRSEADVREIILVHEILQRADDHTREVFKLLSLGYSFEELAKKYGMGANHLRSHWSKQVKKLKKQIRAETRAAERNIMQKFRREPQITRCVSP